MKRTLPSSGRFPYPRGFHYLSLSGNIFIHRRNWSFDGTANRRPAKRTFEETTPTWFNFDAIPYTAECLMRWTVNLETNFRSDVPYSWIKLLNFRTEQTAVHCTVLNRKQKWSPTGWIKEGVSLHSQAKGRFIEYITKPGDLTLRPKSDSSIHPKTHDSFSNYLF